jgi:hypothetical protein
LDYSVEVFKQVQGAGIGPEVFETLGEHLFIQLKSTQSAKTRKVKVFARINVEKTREVLDKKHLISSLDVAVQQLDSSELVTIQRMGVAVPVLLVIADLKAQCCYFVCLNDYIDKILGPRFGRAATAKSRSIDVPMENVLMPGGMQNSVLRWYAKRSKLFSAFQRFVFQFGNLETEPDDEALIEMAQYFAERIVHYDFWDDTEIWEILGHYGVAVRHFLASGDATRLRLEPGITEYERNRKDGARPNVRAMDILRLWKLLSHLPSNYEDVCREWFLPTALGCLTSYRSRGRGDSIGAKLTEPKL